MTVVSKDILTFLLLLHVLYLFCCGHTACRVAVLNNTDYYYYSFHHVYFYYFFTPEFPRQWGLCQAVEVSLWFCRCSFSKRGRRWASSTRNYQNSSSHVASHIWSGRRKKGHCYMLQTRMFTTMYEISGECSRCIPSEYTYYKDWHRLCSRIAQIDERTRRRLERCTQTHQVQCHSLQCRSN